ncbi:MAG TPA: hypothetical protein V6C58_27750, partial [Allocoleopsis sp.]
MCNSFAKIAKIELISIKPKKAERVKDIYEYYGVAEGFKIHLFLWKEFPYMTIFYITQLIYFLILQKFIKKIKYDILYGRYLPGIFIANIFGFKTGLELHVPPSTKIFSKILFKKLIEAKKFKGLVVISDQLKSDILDIYPSLINKIFVAHDGADIPHNSSVPKKSRIHDYESNNTLNVGYVGHLYRGRGTQLLIDMAKECAFANFHIIGGTESDIQYWKQKASTVQNIIFHGYISPNSTSYYREKFDILVAPYEKDVSIAGNKFSTVRWMSPLKIFE